MELLLDTCTFLWFILDSPELSKPARQAIESGANRVYLSSVSVWEITLKHALSKLPLPIPPDKLVVQQRVAHELDALAFDEAAAVFAGKLPAYHKDPFDRMLVCQALSEKLLIVTPDEAFQHYPIETLW
jgi:PIN domain nuclease of toxin-antitoxin system